MTLADFQQFILQLEDVQQDDSYGYHMYFVGDEHLVPFVSIATEDNDYDAVSNLNRGGLYRLNIGVSRKTYDSLFDTHDTEGVDFTVVDTVLPHPQYAKQNFICIISPSSNQQDATKAYITEAHELAIARLNHKHD